MKNTETGLAFIKPKKGKYRIVTAGGGISSVDLTPSKCSMRLKIGDLRPTKDKKVWDTLFDSDGACRLKYEGSRPIYWWADDSFMLYVDGRAVYFEQMA